MELKGIGRCGGLGWKERAESGGEMEVIRVGRKSREGMEG